MFHLNSSWLQNWQEMAEIDLGSGEFLGSTGQCERRSTTAIPPVLFNELDTGIFWFDHKASQARKICEICGLE